MRTPYTARGAGSFTVAAGTCVLGSQLFIVAGQDAPAAGLWFVGLLLWEVVLYVFFAPMTVREEKQPLGGGLNGAWLIAAVATQSVSVLSSNVQVNH
jgi:hypothetical protein